LKNYFVSVIYGYNKRISDIKYEYKIETG